MRSLHPHLASAKSTSFISSPVASFRCLVALVLVVSLIGAGCGNSADAAHAQQMRQAPADTMAPERVAQTQKRATPTPQPTKEWQQTSLRASSDVADTGSATSVLPLNRTVNVLVLGSDRRPHMPNWRTDVIMIIAMDLDRGEAGVISIPRDVYIDEIPNHRPNRINVIDYLGEQDEPDGGGPKLLAEILEEKLGISIHHYLRFDFEGFKQVVDALGGLEITLDCPVYDYLPEEDINLALGAGTHRLTGKQALGYVRSRRQGGDLARARRQQQVIWAVRDQILRENLISRVPALYAALHDSVQTDVSLVSAIRFVRFALALEEEDVHGMVISPPDLVTEGWRQGMFVFVADWERIGEQIQMLFDRPPLIDEGAIAGDAEQTRCP